jgi:hypothetical protein
MTLALVAAFPSPTAPFPSPTAHGSVRVPEGAAIPVRYVEGTVHGFLELTTEAGALLGHGDLLQTATRGGMASRMVFHFRNASVFDEAVTFTQHGVFALETYHLVQSGPAFAEDLDVSLSRSGSYLVKTKSHKDGEEHRYEGTLTLPPDVYNGMLVIIAKNAPARDTTTVHLVAFTPQPRLVRLELAPSGSQRVLIGQHEETAVKFTLKPRLGALLLLGAKATGKAPPDSYVWIVTNDVPAFVRSEGPMYSGPVWRVTLASPAWPK